MATSGTYTDSANNLAIISAALRKINRLGDFETLTDTDVRYTAALATLKLIVKEMATMGMPVWALTETEIPFSSITTAAGYTWAVSNGSSPEKLLQALRRDNTTADTQDVPIEIWTYDRWMEVPNKEEEGTPLACFWQPKGPGAAAYGAGVLKVWPLPDSTWQTNGGIVLRYQRPLQDVGASTDNLDFPRYWQRAVVYTLAYDLAPDYGVDVNLRAALKKDKEELVARAEGFMTEEGSLFIQPVRNR